MPSGWIAAMDVIPLVLPAALVAVVAVVLFRRGRGGTPEKGYRITSTAGKVVTVLLLLAVIAVGFALLQGR